MEVINKKLKQKFYSTFVISLLIFQLCFGANKQYVKIKNVSIKNSICSKYEFTITDHYLNSQTLTYLQQPDLKKLVEEEIGNSITTITDTNQNKVFVNQFNSVGKNFFEKFIDKSIAKELKLKDTHYVFYHGQKLEFLLFQDLFKSLYKICFNKNFKNFFMLRIPDENHAKFKTISDFLNFYINNGEIFDEKKNFDLNEEISNLLLSVNPSLFGNVGGVPGASSFDYFLNSTSCVDKNIFNFTKNIFSFLKIEPLFQKYQKEIARLINLLSSYNSKKTGLLLQIFIPKNRVNDIAYRSIIYGYLFSQEDADSLSLENYQRGALSYLEKHPVSSLLEKYQQNTLLPPEHEPEHTMMDEEKLLTDALNPENKGKVIDASKYFKKTEPVKKSNNNLEDTLDEEVQFRLLINEEMLNPNSGIKMFRYYNETENVKEYKKQLKKLAKLIAKDINKNESYS